LTTAGFVFQPASPPEVTEQARNNLSDFLLIIQIENKHGKYKKSFLETKNN